jgi:hypothetical protein
MKKTLIIALFGLFIVYACSKSKSTVGDNPEIPLDCSTVTAKMFAADVNPIIQSKCATNSDCHGSGSGNGPGALLTYTAVFNARAQIREAVASGRMPLTGSITAAQKNSILCWVDSGAPNN